MLSKILGIVTNYPRPRTIWSAAAQLPLLKRYTRTAPPLIGTYSFEQKTQFRVGSGKRKP